MCAAGVREDGEVWPLGTPVSCSVLSLPDVYGRPWHSHYNILPEVRMLGVVVPSDFSTVDQVVVQLDFKESVVPLRTDKLTRGRIVSGQFAACS